MLLHCARSIQALVGWAELFRLSLAQGWRIWFSLISTMTPCPSRCIKRIPALPCNGIAAKVVISYRRRPDLAPPTKCVQHHQSQVLPPTCKYALPGVAPLPCDVPERPGERSANQKDRNDENIVRGVESRFAAYTDTAVIAAIIQILVFRSRGVNALPRAGVNAPSRSTIIGKKNVPVCIYSTVQGPDAIPVSFFLCWWGQAPLVNANKYCGTEHSRSSQDQDITQRTRGAAPCDVRLEV